MLTPLDPWIEACIGARPAPEALARYQAEERRATLDFARRRSPFYRQLLAGLPEPLSKLPWAAIPFTKAADLVRHGNEFLCGSMDEIARVVTLFSSGTTAPPKRVHFTREDLARTLDFFAVGMSGIVSPGDRVLILLPGDRPDSVGDLLKRGLARIGCTGVLHGPVTDPGDALAVIDAENIDALVGIPVQVLSLVRADAGVPDAGRRIRNVLLTTDHVPQAVRKAVEAAWHCRVFNHYGMTEMGLGGGVECAVRDGYHLREADLYVEVVDPETGAVLPAGVTGEIVFTTLTRRGMPLIRYRTGDLGRFLADPCPCGSLLRRLSRVCTRAGGNVRLGRERCLTLADLDEALFAIPWMLNFQAALMEEGGAAVLALVCRITAGAPLEAAEAVKAAAGGIPAVAAAAHSGRLRVVVTCAQSMDLPISTGTGKRVLAVHRKARGQERLEPKPLFSIKETPRV